MIYEEVLNITTEYNVDYLNLKDIVLFTTKNRDNPTLISGYSGSYSFEEICYYVANYTNNNNLGTTISFMIQTDDGIALINSNYIDCFSIYYEGTCSISAQRVNQTGGGYLFDSDLIDNYVSNNFNVGFNDYTYDEYSRPINQNYQIFDYSNLKYGSGYDYTSDTLVVRGENTSFYYTYLMITNSGSSLFALAYGRPYASIRESAYNNGYNAGYNGGFVKGQEIGFQNGVNSSGTTLETTTAFSYIEGAFKVVDNVLSLEVLPNVTLGLAFSIPLVFVLIMTIFKLVRK